MQVRISNGSAFLVGNASAPPTDDKTANVAHFVAEQADEKATEAIETANAIVQTVSEKVSIGDSNVAVLSSTMYQNAYGVNVYNDELSVGDSYAHIDGDEFCIREVTSAGVIDENDTKLASFGASGAVIGKANIDDEYWVEIANNSVKIKTQSIDGDVSEGWEFDDGGISFFRNGTIPQDVFANLSRGSVQFAKNGLNYEKEGVFSYEVAHVGKIENGVYNFTSVQPDKIVMTGSVQDANGNHLTPTILTSTTISAATTSYTFSDAAITADSVIDIYDTIFGFAPTGMTVSAGSATVTFPAQSSSHTIKLFVY